MKRKRESTHTFYVYILQCEDGSYYTGYTSNLISRFVQHKKGSGARYTRLRRPKKIIYVEKFGTRSAAMRRERQIKCLTHDQKREFLRKT